MAADILNVTINFDANISKVVNDDDEWTTSGQTYGISTWGLLPFVVTLSDGYVLDTVVVNSTRAALNTKTDTQFTLSDISAANYEAEITLTSKAATTTVTLSAGIYIFKEVPATPSFTSGYEVPLTFTYTDSEETLSCTKIFFATDEDSGDLAMNYYTYISDGNEYVSEQVYIFESDFWNHDWFKIITVTADQSVPEDFYNWFTANTTAQSSKLSVDLTTLSGWSNLSAGSHVIKLVAKGTGYRDSEKSAGVEVTKAAVAYTDCLTFTGETSEFTLAVGTNGAKEWDGTIYYSTDHNTWNVWDGTAISSANKKLYLRGKNNTKFYTSKGVRLSLSAKAACSGNIQTLLDWENPPTSIPTKHCYTYMFFNCANLTTAPELPATTLANNCYYWMFYGCTSLTTAPALPATTLTENCYDSMFYGCTSLTTAPALPATTLSKYCYYEMFYGCTSLTTAPALPATTLSEACYFWMFKSCTKLKVNTSSGNKIFTCPSSIPRAAVTEMFANTGGTFTGTPTAGNTYYWTE